MKRKTWFTLGTTGLLLALALLALLGGGLVLAQSGGSFDLSWFTVDGGGGAAVGGAYALSGAVGQPDAGSMSGGSYVLGGGFWQGIAAQTSGDSVYLPLIIRAP